MITLFIVEDDEFTRLALKSAVERIDGFRIVGEAEDGRAAVLRVLECKPDVVLMDIELPLLDGIDATQEIKKASRDIKVVMLTSHQSDQGIFAAFAAGADGYCVKGASMNRISLAIRTVADGAGWLDPAIADRVLHAPQQSGSTSTPKPAGGNKLHTALSEREVSVLRLVAEGLSNPEIGKHLCLGSETVKTHIRRIMEKLLVDDRTQAAVLALRQGLI